MLKVENLSSSYDHTFNIQSISFDIKPGEIILITGKNGSGKSTLLKTIIGLIPLKGGHVYLDNKLIDNLKTHERIKQGISFVFQERRLFMRLTVEENLRVAIYKKQDEINTLDSIYNQFPIIGKKRQILAGNLSGGEQEVLALARAFIQEPKIILLDEPFAGLSKNKIDECVNIITYYKENNTAFIIADHSTDAVTTICSKKMRIHSGKIEYVN